MTDDKTVEFDLVTYPILFKSNNPQRLCLEKESKIGLERLNEAHKNGYYVSQMCSSVIDGVVYLTHYLNKK